MFVVLLVSAAILVLGEAQFPRPRCPGNPLPFPFRCWGRPQECPSGYFCYKQFEYRKGTCCRGRS
ncbi:uncharacterized protein LOC111102424 isoform X2 [Crassostrea virginica]